MLGLAAVAAALLAGQAREATSPASSSGFGVVAAPRVAYTFVGGAVAKVDADSGAVLATWRLGSAINSPSLAVSRDGKSIFVLNTVWDGSKAHDRLSVLAADILTPHADVPTEKYQSAGWPPALAVMGDDRTVAVYHIDFSPGAPGSWLSYFDRQSGGFATDQTVLPGCGAAQLTPVAQQLAVLCFGSNDVRVVSLASRQVVRAVSLSRPRAGNTPGWAVAAGVLPGGSTLAVIKDDGSLVHVNLAAGRASTVGDIVPGDHQVIPKVGGAAFSANGRAVIALLDDPAGGPSGAASTLLVVDTAAGRVLDRVALPVPTHYGLDVSPDGRRAFVRTGPIDDLQVQTVDLSGHTTRAFGTSTTRIWPHLVFSN